MVEYSATKDITDTTQNKNENNDNTKWITTKNKPEIKGCGCTYRKIVDDFMDCEYLCQQHASDFLLRLYNNQAYIKFLKEKGVIISG